MTDTTTHTPTSVQDAVGRDDMNDAMKGNYMLLTLSLSRWNASKPDKQLALEAASAHGATPEAVRVTKKLMAGADAELKAVERALNAIRSYIYAVSLPWAGNVEGAKRGPRLIPTAQAMNIIKRTKELQDVFRAALDELKSVYTARVQQALAHQGSLADPTQYPHVDELDNMFTVRIDLEPVPTVADFSRMSIPAELSTALGQRMAGRQAKVIENAMADLTTRVVNAVGNMATQLHKHASGEKTRLYASLVDNVKQLLGLLRTANLTSDPRLVEIADMMDDIVLHDIKTLKDNVGTAKQVADKAASIVKILKPDTEPPAPPAANALPSAPAEPPPSAVLADALASEAQQRDPGEDEDAEPSPDDVDYGAFMY